MQIYISGPMTGYPDDNRSAFNEMQDQLEAAGHQVLNPARVSLQTGSWEAYMRVDLRMLLNAEAVVALPGWQKSRGARLEIAVANHLGMPVLCYPQMIELVQNTEVRVERTYDGLLI